MVEVRSTRWVTPVYGSEKVLRLIAKLYEANRDVTSTSLRIVNAEPAILIERAKCGPVMRRSFTMHCELNDDSRMRLHFVLAPSKLRH
jgi:hypothetical protein